MEKKKVITIIIIIKKNRFCTFKYLLAPLLVCLGSISGPVGRDVLNPVLSSALWKLLPGGPEVPPEELTYRD